MRPDLAETQDVNDDEKALVQPVYEDTAKRFGYSTLTGLQIRERALRSAAVRTNDADERARRTGLADEVANEIEQALAIGQVVVIRQRSSNAVSDGLAWFLYAVVIVGLLAFAVSAAKVQSKPPDLTAKAKACGDARKGGATGQELGKTNFCQAVGDMPPPPPAPAAAPTAAEARAQLAFQLAAVLKACAALEGGKPGRPLQTHDCNAVTDAFKTIINP
jgi:hypothetical protein